MNPSPKARAEADAHSTDEIRGAAQDNLERISIVVDLLALATDIPIEVVDGLQSRIKVVSGAVNVLAERAS